MRRSAPLSLAGTGPRPTGSSITESGVILWTDTVRLSTLGACAENGEILQTNKSAVSTWLTAHASRPVRTASTSLRRCPAGQAAPSLWWRSERSPARPGLARPTRGLWPVSLGEPGQRHPRKTSPQSSKGITTPYNSGVNEGRITDLKLQKRRRCEVWIVPPGCRVGRS